jgi:hypothetical protein
MTLKKRKLKVQNFEIHFEKEDVRRIKKQVKLSINQIIIEKPISMFTSSKSVEYHVNIIRYKAEKR